MKKILTILAIVILIAGIAIGVYLVKIQQIFKSKATLEGTRIEIVDNNGNVLTATSSARIKVKLTYVASASATPSPTPTASPTLSPTPATSVVPSPTAAPIIIVCTACKADINNDGAVTILDQSRINVCFNRQATEIVNNKPCSDADINADGVITILDSSCLGSKFNQLCPENRSTPTSSPSPIASPSPSPTVSLTLVNGSVSGVAKAQEVFPTHFRVANTQENLIHAPERLFDSNPKLIGWQLLSDNGQQTVYAQLKVNNVWSETYSASVELTGQPPPTFEMGLEAGQQFDISKVDLVSQTNASWVRLNFIVKNNWSGVDDLQFISTYNQIINAYTQKGIKIIGLIGAESVKQGFDRTKPAEFKDRLVDVADKITQAFGSSVKVYEVFNEPNDWAGGTSSQLSPDSFASLLNAVYQKVKIEKNRTDLTLVSGPIFSHDLSGGSSGDTGEDYLRFLYTAFNQDNPYPLDAIGLHIYIEQDSSQRAAIESAIRRNLEGIKRVIREFDPDKKIWISEMGWGTGAVNEEVQANNLQVAFNTLKSDPAVRMAMWFTLLDFDAREYGLIRGNGNRKQAFQRFTTLASQLRPSPSPSPSPTSSPSPTPSPSPSISPTPSASPTTAPSPTPMPTSSPSPGPASTPTPTPRSGKSRDVNGDGKVNSIDVSLMFRRWNSRTSTDLSVYDLNSDGVINSFDYTLFKKDFSP